MLVSWFLIVCHLVSFVTSTVTMMKFKSWDGHFTWVSLEKFIGSLFPQHVNLCINVIVFELCEMVMKLGFLANSFPMEPLNQGLIENEIWMTSCCNLMVYLIFVMSLYGKCVSNYNTVVIIWWKSYFF